jgi:hypothetical protein
MANMTIETEMAIATAGCPPGTILALTQGLYTSLMNKVATSGGTAEEIAALNLARKEMDAYRAAGL